MHLQKDAVKTIDRTCEERKGFSENENKQDTYT